MNERNFLILLVFFLFPNPLYAQNPETKPVLEASAGEQIVEPSLESMGAAIAASNWVEAQIIGEALTARPEARSNEWALLGFVYSQDKNFYSKAEACFLKVRELSPNDVENLKNLAVIKKLLQREDATDFAVLAAEASLGSSEMQLYAARELEGSNRRDEAEKYYSRVLELDKGNLVALTNLGSFFSGRGEYSKLIELYTNAIENDGVDHVVVQINLLNAFNLAARYEECLQWSEKFLQKNNEPSIMSARLEALTKLKRFTQVEELIKPKSENKLISPSEEYYLALALSLQGCNLKERKTCNTKEKQACCEKDIQALGIFEKLYLDEKNALNKDVDLRYGLALIANDRLEDAEALLQESLDKAKAENKGVASYFAALSVCMYLFGEKRDLEMSLQYYREAVENAPDFAEAKRMEDFRQWPPYSIEVLKTNEERALKIIRNKSKCSCDFTHESSPNPLVLFLASLAILALLLRRRAKQSA